MDPTKKELYTAKRSSDVNVSSPAIREAWAAIRNDADPTDWALLQYTSQPGVVDVVATGSGGVDEMLTHLSNDKVSFVGGRRTRGGATRFYFFYFVGRDIGSMARGKASMHKNAVVKLFEGLHGEAAAVSEDDDGGLEGARARAKEQIEKI